MKLASMLAAKRRNLDLTFRDAALRAGVDPATFFRAESKGLLPDARNLLAMCRWLDVSVEYALTGEEPEHAGCSRCVELQARLDYITAAVVGRAPEEPRNG